MTSSTPDWFVFQEKIKDFFISIGAEAETNVRVQGVRTTHDIDVAVKTRFLGEDLTWLIEAKHWNSKVKKNQVLALRAIMEDIGADRGFIVSKKGFQSGAVEAAKSTNIRLKTFEELKLDSKEFVEAEILKSYAKRLTIIEDRYWSHSKKTRIKYGLRHEITDYPFKFIGQKLLSTARAAILAASERMYPINLETFLEEQKGESIARNFQQLINWLNLNLNHFDEKLLVAEWEMHKNNDYHPKGSRTPDGESTTTQMLANVLHADNKN
jgi:hypothetical protein